MCLWLVVLFQSEEGADAREKGKAANLRWGLVQKGRVGLGWVLNSLSLMTGQIPRHMNGARSAGRCGGDSWVVCKLSLLLIDFSFYQEKYE